MSDTLSNDLAGWLEASEKSSSSSASTLVLCHSNGESCKEVDILWRAYTETGENGKNTLNIQSANTSDFLSIFRKLAEENSLLKSVVKNLWNTVQYNNEYSAYLLGQYTDDEFYKVAETFSVTPLEHIDQKYLKFAVNFMHEVVEEELSSSDYSVMLNVDCSVVESSLLRLTRY